MSRTGALVGIVAAAALVAAPRLLTRLSSAWRMDRALQRRRADDPHLERAAALHRAMAASDRAPALDDREWSDLDLDDVFVSLDHAVSEPGRQHLYRLLRTPRHDVAALERLEAAVRRFTDDPALAARARRALARLGDPRAAQLVTLVHGELPARPALWWAVPLLTAAAIACIVLLGAWPQLVLVAIGIAVANVLVQLVYKPRVRTLIPALHEIPRFLQAAAELGAPSAPEIAAECATLAAGARRLAGLRRAARWLVFEPGQGNELAASAYEYVNLALLLDVNAFLFGVERIRASRATIGETFAALGFIDAAQSIAAWRATLPVWSAPTFVARTKALRVDGLAHPLVDAAVQNDLTLATSALITGSNMSGKTTLVRALGVNAVLAQTLHTVCATRWEAPLLCVRTSIGRSDSVTEGKSYYLAEVESVLRLIRARESGAQHLFLLDELYRGTNTAERVAAAYGVLRHLDQGDDLVVVATHDVELLAMLGDRYAAHHFREHVADGALTFDYHIRPGPCSTRNAIALLRLMNYPVDVVRDAMAVLE